MNTVLHASWMSLGSQISERINPEPTDPKEQEVLSRAEMKGSCLLEGLEEFPWKVLVIPERLKSMTFSCTL